LARELGTSHQLLSHYLEHWGKWQAREYRRKAVELRARAAVETRPGVASEMLNRAEACEHAAFQYTIESVLENAFRQIERDAKACQLKPMQVKMLRAFASHGHTEAQELLRKRRGAEKPKNNLPSFGPCARKSFRQGEGVGGNSSKTRGHAGHGKTAKSPQDVSAMGVSGHAVA